ncbi:MAG: dihydroorotase [Methylococcaceae bacterium]|nr:dihydroorotase [Methylococcaceae bacterium]
MQSISFTCPDDWHLHLRDGDPLRSVLPHTARQFNRAVIMPNLSPPVDSIEAALAYRSRIIESIPEGMNFTPLPALYLTDCTTTSLIRRASETDCIIGFKLYPAGATTHSASGVSDPSRIYPLYEAMQKFDVPLLIHGEVTDPDTDIFDREKIFIGRYLEDIVRQFPDLRIVLEHATTREAVQFVCESSSKVAATLTAQHLLYNRNILFSGGIRPHHYCLPVLKREHHRRALLKAAVSGNPKFFLGTDSAPHPQTHKESSSGCAGCYTAHAALELYTEIFEREGALDKLEGFASFFGADFYGLERNRETVTLERQDWTVPENYPLGNETVVPLKAGQPLRWKFSGKIGRDV